MHSNGRSVNNNLSLSGIVQCVSINQSRSVKDR